MKLLAFVVFSFSIDLFLTFSVCFSLFDVIKTQNTHFQLIAQFQLFHFSSPRSSNNVSYI